MINLRKMLNPKNIAFVSSDAEEGSAERTVLANLSGPGTRLVFQVNPNREPAPAMNCFRSISDIQEEVDLAVVMVPCGMLLETCEQCANNGAKGLVIMPAGGRAPADVYDTIRPGLMRMRNTCGMRIIGPGSSGIILPNDRLNVACSWTRSRAGRPLYLKAVHSAMRCSTGAVPIISASACSFHSVP